MAAPLMINPMQAIRRSRAERGYYDKSPDAYAAAMGRPTYSNAKEIPSRRQLNPGAKNGDPVETIDVSGARPDPTNTVALPEQPGMPVSVPQPMPNPGDAGWNDISRYQRTSGASDSGGGGMPTPGGAGPVSGALHDGAASAHRGIYDTARGLRPTGAGGISQGIHNAADRGVGSALTRGLMGGQSRNNQRYAQAAASSRRANQQHSQIQQLTSNGRTYEQALDELGLRGDPMWDEAARKPLNRSGPRPEVSAGGAERFNRYMP